MHGRRQGADGCETAARPPGMAPESVKPVAGPPIASPASFGALPYKHPPTMALLAVQDHCGVMPPAPLRRKRPGPEETQDCDCCDAVCDCQDCERCRDAAVQVATEWIPPAAQGTAAKPSAPGKKAGKGTRGAKR